MTKAWLIKITTAIIIFISPQSFNGSGLCQFKHLYANEISTHKYPDLFLKDKDTIEAIKDTAGIRAGISTNEYFYISQHESEIKILEAEIEKAERKLNRVIILSIVIFILFASIPGIYIYRQNQKFKILKDATALEKNRFKVLIEAQEMDWKRIAGDLHDSVGQLLSLSKLHLSEVIDSSEVSNPEHELMLNRTAQIIDEACQEVRNISHNLMPGPLIRLGLVSAIKELVRKINSSRKVKVAFSSNIKDIRFNEKIEISLYRILQEISSNILKHSGATEVDISLNLQDNQRLNLSIKDNGVGFDTEEIEKSDGIGWKNIYTRLAIINGTMNIDSEINHGTGIEINVIL